jgi:hypothetical protein
MLLNEYLLVQKKILSELQYDMSPETLKTYLHIWNTQPYINVRKIITTSNPHSFITQEPCLY